MKFAPEIEAAIARAVRETGIPEARLRAMIQIESGGRANAQTGSYLGALQLSQSEFKKYGGGSNIFDPTDNIVTGARKLMSESAALAKQLGREPTTGELYLVHQQGGAGAGAHRANPDGVAWQNVRPYYSDEAARARGFPNGDAYARAAIWGNVPDDMKAQFGSVDKITSRQFTDLWNSKVARFGGGDVPAPAGPVTQFAAPPEEGKIYFTPDQASRPMQSDGNAGRMTGSVMVNGKQYPWVSGGTGRGALPMGEYTASPMTTGAQRAAAGNSYTRDAFPLSDAPDTVPGDPMRRGLLVHDAAGAGATAGCIGIDGNFHAFSKDFTAEMAAKAGLTPAWSDGKNVVVGKAPLGTEITMANAQDGPGTNPTVAPVAQRPASAPDGAPASPVGSSPVVTSSTSARPSSGWDDATGSAALQTASAWFQEQAKRNAEQNSDAQHQMQVAAKAASGTPGPSPMLPGSRLPNVDIRQLLGVLKARGIDPTGANQSLGSNARSILGT